MPRPTRIRPFFNSMLYAARRAATVETFACGEFDPSLVRKMGSIPRVFSNRARTSWGEIAQPVEGTWHETHDLPFVPRLWKNGFEKSSGRPSSVIVRSTPDGFGVSSTER